MLPVAVFLGAAIYLISVISYWHSKSSQPPESMPTLVAANPEYEIGPLWEDGEILTDAKTGERIVWKKEKK